jgi:hypothetical protein
MTISTPVAQGNTFVDFPTAESLFKRDFSDLDPVQIEILALAELAWEEAFALPLPDEQQQPLEYVFIPKNVWKLPLKPLYKFILATAINFRDEGLRCSQTNKQLAERFNVSSSTIQRAIRELVRQGRLTSIVETSPGKQTIRFLDPTSN